MKDKRHENLIPQAHVLTVDEQSKGGVKSVEVRRGRKKAREIAEILLSMPVSSDELQSLDDLDSLADVDNVDTLTTLIVNAVKKALEGSYRHLELVLTLTGDYSKRMQLEVQEKDVDESIQRLDEILGSRVWDEVTNDTLSQDKYEKYKLDDEVEDAAKWMYHYYNNIYQVHGGRFEYKKSDSEILEDFRSATDEHKLNFIQRIYRKRDIPKDDAILLFDTVYAPRVIDKKSKLQANIPKNNLLAGIE